MILAVSERLIRIRRVASAAALCDVAVVVALTVVPESAGAASVDVLPGQTLWQIAVDHNTTVAALQALNGITDPNQIVAGWVLQLPGASPSASGGSVVVEAGQTLSSIASQYGTTVAALEAVNGLANPNQIVAGSTLQLPGVASQVASPSGKSVVVTAGQTLSSIAEQHDTTVTTLESLNGISNPNDIEIGAVLQLPGGMGATPSAVAPSARIVVVAPGQTLSSIATSNGTTVAALQAVNGLANPNLIEAGMRLRLPESSTMALASYIVAQATSLPAGLLAYPNRLALRPVFAHWAAVSGVPPALLEAMCWWESGWQASVTSVTGAIGVCQLEPATVAQEQARLGLPALNPNLASDNIEMAASYLDQLLAATGGDAASALAGYYQGLASVSASGWFPSTQQYVKGILAYVPYFN